MMKQDYSRVLEIQVSMELIYKHIISNEKKPMVNDENLTYQE